MKDMITALALAFGAVGFTAALSAWVYFYDELRWSRQRVASLSAEIRRLRDREAFRP